MPTTPAAAGYQPTRDPRRQHGGQTACWPTRLPDGGGTSPVIELQHFPLVPVTTSLLPRPVPAGLWGELGITNRISKVRLRPAPPPMLPAAMPATGGNRRNAQSIDSAVQLFSRGCFSTTATTTASTRMPGSTGDQGSSVSQTRLPPTSETEAAGIFSGRHRHPHNQPLPTCFDFWLQASLRGLPTFGLTSCLCSMVMFEGVFLLKKGNTSRAGTYGTSLPVKLPLRSKRLTKVAAMTAPRLVLVCIRFSAS